MCIRLSWTVLCVRLDFRSKPITGISNIGMTFCVCEESSSKTKGHTKRYVVGKSMNLRKLSVRDHVDTFRSDITRLSFSFVSCFVLFLSCEYI